MAQPRIAPRYESSSQMIIQCPSCSTKFAIDAHLVQEIEDPKFHCSRCDFVFDFAQLNRAPRITSPSVSSASSVSSSSVSAGGAENEGAAASPRTRTTSQPRQAAIASELSAELSEGIVAVYKDSTQRIDGAPRSASEVKPLEIPKRWDDSLRTSAPQENVVDPAPASPTPSSHTSLFSPQRSSSSQFAFGQSAGGQSVSSQARESQLGNAQSATRALIEETIEIDHLGTIKNSPLAEDAALESVPTAGALRPLLHHARFGGPRHQLSPFRALVAPIVGLLVVLGCVTAILTISTVTSESAVARLLPIIPAVPADLYVRDTKFRRIVLDNGEAVRLISGTISNESDRTISALKLEGVVFDGAGRKLSSLIVDAGSPLSKSKISSLTADMIAEMQSTKSAKRFTIRPGEKREFAIALLGKDLEKASHYTARIYSVGSVN